MAVEREAALEARGITVALGGRTVLRDAALRVAAGEVVAVLAPSGAGKSTLLRAIVGLAAATGTVSVEGTDTATLPATTLRRRVAFVAQTPVMLPGSVADNLSHGVPDLSAAERDDALVAAGLDATFAQRRAAELSGGERARVALARALTREPRVLLLDEPTAALDHDAAQVIGATLRRLADRGLGIVLATHDEAFAARWADRQVRL